MKKFRKIKTKIIDSNLLYSNTELENYFREIYNKIKFLHSEYPKFKEWYFNKVVYDILNNKNRRLIILKEINSEIAGISILKQDGSENKICNLRITDKYKGIGLGYELLSQSVDILECDKPYITVSSKRIHEFNKLLNNFDFKLSYIYNNYYQKGETEYFFNAPYDPVIDQPSILVPTRSLK